MTEGVKTPHWTPETRDALVLAEAVAKAMSEEELRHMLVTMETGKLRLSVEARR